MAQAGTVSRGVACALLVATMTAGAAAGTFERWIGNPVGWVSNDAERATLTKNVKQFRATLPGHAAAVETGHSGFEIWINIGCRARNPAEAPMAWIALPDHPEQPPAPHWLTDPVDFVYTLVRHGEFEITPLTMRTDGAEARATIIRRRVIAWTEGDRPWLSVEFEGPERTAATVLGLIAREAGPDTITLSGAGTRIELHPEWDAAERALARDMRKHCPADRNHGRLGIRKKQEPMLALPALHNCSLNFTKPLRYCGHHGDSESGRAPTPPPGAQLMWRGYTQLVAMFFAFELSDEYG